MFGELDALVHIRRVEIDVVDDLDVLPVRRIGADHPGIHRQRRYVVAHVDRQILLRHGKFRKLPPGLETVERPDEAEFLEAGKFENARGFRRRIANAGLAANALAVVLPFVKCAADMIATDVARREIRTHVRAIGAQDLCHAIFAAESNDAPVEEWAADHLTLSEFIRRADREPRLGEYTVLAFEGNRLAPRTLEGGLDRGDFLCGLLHLVIAPE